MENKTPDNAHYDRVITPAETAARIEREGENFNKKPEKEGDLDTTGGYTIDREGLANNYAVEPEMYYETPGDRQEIIEAEKAERREEIEDVNTPGGKGTGLV